MRPHFSIGLLAASIAMALTLSHSAHGEQLLDDDGVQTVTIIGSKKDAKNVAGSAHVVNEAELEQMKYTDATRALQEVPGVYIQHEDGLGLRPNIGLRGVPTERSGHISLMEDGVLIAPAPYAASSAYYFPTFDRITGIEVLKGAASTKYGPFTVGGAINFLSRPIPEQAEGQITLEAGADGQARGHFYYGDSSDNFGYLIEANKHQYDGFKTIDRHNDDTGFEKDDYVAKFRINSDSSANVYQQFDFKIQHSTEDSDQSYLGLTDADFQASPYRMYGLSALDNFDGEHDQLMASYYADFNNGFDLKLIAYRNETKRNWFKTEKLNGTSWSNIVNSINNGNDDGSLQAILDGGDTSDGAVTIRDNNRQYLSRGLQLELGWEFTTGLAEHQLDLGIRTHEDEEDRFQRDGKYTQRSGSLVVSDAGVFSNAGNRLQSAEAKSYYIQDTISIGDWVLTPGLRYEDIELQREDWGKQPLRDAANLSLRQNSVSEVLPGFGALWSINDKVSMLAGVNKGFSPPGNKAGDLAEESWNYEFGFRFSGNNYSSELIAFVDDYDNILGECTQSNGGCDIDNQGDKSNGGKAKTQGFELLVQGHFSDNVPVSFTYTYTDSEFQRTFDSDAWGQVIAGDAIPYIPEQQWQLAIGYEGNDWNLFANLNYVDEVCTKAECERVSFLKTDELLTLDLSAEYSLNKSTTLFATLDNALEEDGIAARQPYGARPTKGRSAKLGVKFNF